MHRYKVVVFAYVVACLLGVGIVSSASAASVLPEFSTSTPGTATLGESGLSVESTTVTCKAGSAKLGAGARSGTYALELTSCKSVGKECKSLGQAAGTIVVKGEWHVTALLKFLRKFHLWALVGRTEAEAVQVECASPVGTLILLWGNVLGSIEETTERTFKVAFETEGSGATLKQKVTEFGNNEGVAVKASLKGKIDSGAEREAFVNSKEYPLFTEKSTKLLES
jgi:hypothetical protein